MEEQSREGEPMKWRITTVVLATSLLATLLVLSNSVAEQESSVLSLETHIPLPNVKDRIDHLSVDVKGQRLFVAAVDNHTLEVVDLKSGQRVHTITDLAEPQGVFYDESTNRLFVACGLDGVTKIFDGTTFQILATVKFPDDADNIRYDTRSKGVIVGYAGAKQLRKRVEGTGGLGFLDSNGKKTGDLVIDAHPESFQLEEAGTRLFVNVPEKKEIEVVDAVKRTVLARWPVTSAQNNFPMALDEAHHRLFVGCCRDGSSGVRKRRGSPGHRIAYVRVPAKQRRPPRSARRTPDRAHTVPPRCLPAHGRSAAAPSRDG